MTKFKEYEVTLRVRIQCTGTGTPEDIVTETIEALSMHDQWPVEVLNLDDGTITQMTIPAAIRGILNEGGVMAENIPGFDPGDEVVFEEITFSEDGNRMRPGRIVEVLQPKRYYTVEVEGGGLWTVAAEQISRP